MDLIIVFFFSYISGSIPFGLILTKVFKGKDIRKTGSGNIGATNVLRSGNKILAFFTLSLDIIKGYVPVILTKIYYPEFIHMSALVAFLGHIFPIWLKFKGGKGVATFLGILFALSQSLTLLFVLTWIGILMIFKYSSLSSIFATLSVFVISFIKESAIDIIEPNLNNSDDLRILLFFFLVLIIFTHRKNISHLKKGTENKIKL